MNRQKGKKVTIISLVAVLVVLAVGFGSYRHYMTKTYKRLITTANKHMDAGEYDKAITLFEQSLQYKKDPAIEGNIKLAKSLKEVKGIYDKGMNLIKDKKYLDAINAFEKITKIDEKLYNNAQKNIEECKKEVITENIRLSKDSAKDNKYSEAIEYLDEILKIDKNNLEVQRLKNVFSKSEQDKEPNSTYKDDVKRQVTKEQASEIIREYIKDDMAPSTIVQYDHDVVRDGITYYVIHVYDIVQEHTATRGWYYVDPNSGKAYLYDLSNNKIKSME